MYKNLAVQTLGDAVNGSYPPLSPSSRICCNGVDSKQPTCVTKSLREEMDGAQRMTQVGFENRSVTIIHMQNGPTNGVQNGPKSFNISDRNHEIARQASMSPTADGMLTDDGGPSAARFSPNRLAGSFTSTSYSEPFTSDSGSVAGMISRDEMLNVMTEDLVDWFVQMYPSLTQDLEVDTFYDRLSDGILLCHHAAELHQLLMDQGSITHDGERAVLMGLRIGGIQAVLPKNKPSYQTRVHRGSVATSGFVARDNVANFLIWCRQLGMPDSVLFESEDAVCRKNPRNVAVCLLELARLGGSLGMSVPGLILLEKEIDEELEKSCVITDSAFRTEGLNTHSPDGRKVVIVRENSTDPALFITVDKAVDPPDIPSNESAVENGVSSTVYRSTRSTDLRRKKSLSGSSERYCLDKKKEAVKQKPEIKRPAVDMRSLDEIVRELLSQCTCKQTFPVNRIGEGRYLFGDKCTQIFVRILRNHVMVRVGGGWDTLSHFLSKYDECRKTTNSNNRVTKSVDSTLGNGTSSIDSSNTDELLESLDPNPTRRSTETHVSPIRAQGRLTAIKKSPAPEHKLPNDVSSQNTDKRFPVLRNDTQLHGLNKTCNSSEVGGQLNKRTSMVSGKYQAVEQRIPQKCLAESRNSKQNHSTDDSSKPSHRAHAIADFASGVKRETNVSKNVPRLENQTSRSKAIPEVRPNFQRSKSSTNLVTHRVITSRTPQLDRSEGGGLNRLDVALSKSTTQLTHEVTQTPASRSSDVNYSRNHPVRRKSAVYLSSCLRKTHTTADAEYKVAGNQPWWCTSEQRREDNERSVHVKPGFGLTPGHTTRGTSLIPRPVQCEALSSVSYHSCINQEVSDAC